ncbi:exopolysaccharide biosynthesis polyprenyl glycosylphosphotransferase [Flexibacter flexilis DSM 6793]|uniref:Exopolysaccharide biosynthesis polyprenyl glycosylphosphotransferase n=1 Tax=Flexibacter flexilis DSM 6793 TaxID=927664 RepID=A0A1I1NGC8_9BACT|nr:sugar transferase [Flexibacter flexilis]SFC96587.1 exopolysaccharide biosynthesis polyprenyl glycosylphosphotransferase [Flexibacter flexilis DSM 6793]
MKKNIVRTYYLLADFLAALLAWISFYIARKYVTADYNESVWFTLLESGAVIGLFWLLVYAIAGFYVQVYRRSRVKEVLSILAVSFVGVSIISVAILLDDDVAGHSSFYFYTFAYFLIHSFWELLLRVSVTTHLHRLIRKGIIYFNTVIVGSEQKAKEIYEELKSSNSFLGNRILGYVHTAEEREHLLTEIPHLGSYTNLENIIQEKSLTQVVIATEPSEHKLIEDILNRVEGTNVNVSIIPDLYQILIGAVRVSHVFGTPLVEIRQELMPVWQQVVKRGMDIGASLAVLTIGSPFYLFVSLMTKFSSEGPIFYSQERIGKGGLPFRIYKFRSMYTNAEQAGPALSSDHDPRITPWGRFMRKTRIDEFPQFYNVLIGDMSLVGPRPERQYFIDQIVKVAPHYKHLNRVRPGITSLGQVKYGYAENVEQMVRRLKYDIIYIENMSLAMDFRIMIYTVLTVLKGSGK